jgi:hypothetical protein
MPDFNFTVLGARRALLGYSADTRSRASASRAAFAAIAGATGESIPWLVARCGRQRFRTTPHAEPDAGPSARRLLAVPLQSLIARLVAGLERGVQEVPLSRNAIRILPTSIPVAISPKADLLCSC